MKEVRKNKYTVLLYLVQEEVKLIHGDETQNGSFL